MKQKQMKICDYCNKEIKSLEHIIHFKKNKTIHLCQKCALNVGYLHEYVPILYWNKKNEVHTYTNLKQPNKNIK